jgi:predicted AAA+ superfamily ATPase
VHEVIQVCYALNSDNQKRETEGLLDAMNHFNLNSGTIVSMNQEDVIQIEGKRINVVPAFKYFKD